MRPCDDDLAFCRQRLAPLGLVCEESLLEGQPRAPGCVVKVLPARAAAAALFMAFATAVRDRLDLENALLCDDRHTVGLIVQDPLELRADGVVDDELLLERKLSELLLALLLKLGVEVGEVLLIGGKVLAHHADVVLALIDLLLNGLHVIRWWGL